jgi:hypothetical protein
MACRERFISMKLNRLVAPAKLHRSHH